jgi:endonuclease/exonuclease/phosphatase (EEP) superfamily protein YafD
LSLWSGQGTPATLHLERRRRRLLWAATLLWLSALVVLLALLALFGEASWPVVLLLYLPRHPWILPGVLLLPFALRAERRALLWPLGLGALVWLFPIMGFALPLTWLRPAGPTIRVLSYNTTYAADGVEGLRALVVETRPDLVLFQWTSHLANEALSGPAFEGWTVQRAEQFTVATRFRILSLETGGVPSWSGPPCAHAVLDTPLGTLDVYSIRPQSARVEMGGARIRGVRQRLRRLIDDAKSGRLAELASFREAQARSIAQMVARAQHPVLIAGDSNLPEGSPLLRHYFGGFKDAFFESSWGFGFTYPAKVPWLRLDRVLLGSGLDARSFEVLSRRASAHRPVLAEITRSSPD